MSSGAVERAGHFSYLLIRSYLDDVHAASYPATPQEVGGPTYKYFSEQYQSLSDMSAAGDDKDKVCRAAIQAIRGYLADDSLSGEAARSFSLSMNTAYEHFSTRIGFIDRLEAGDDPEQILKEVREKHDGPAAEFKNAPDVTP